MLHEPTSLRTRGGKAVMTSASPISSTVGAEGIKVNRGNILERADRIIPGGASAGGRPDYKNVLVRAHGTYPWEADGKRYIDHLNSYGPIVIGHTDERVNSAVFSAASQIDLNWVGPQTGKWNSLSESFRQCRRPTRLSS